jgi:hypothetical protein
MAWRYEVGLKDLAPDQVGADLPLGLAIKKVFVDDATGGELVSTAATTQDAKENGQAGEEMGQVARNGGDRQGKDNAGCRKSPCEDRADLTSASSGQKWPEAGAVS